MAFYAGFLTGLVVAVLLFLGMAAAVAILGARRATPKITPDQAAALAKALKTVEKVDP